MSLLPKATNWTKNPVFEPRQIDLTSPAQMQSLPHQVPERSNSRMKSTNAWQPSTGMAL